jgi:AcrR family transcriptional regulator
MSLDPESSETFDRLTLAGRTLLARGDTKFTVARLCAEARVSVEEFRLTFGNKSALIKALLKTPETEAERPLIADIWLERRLRNFELSLRLFEERLKEANRNHALAVARLEEKFRKSRDG